MHPRHILLTLVGCCSIGVTACRDLTGSQSLPSGVPNPSTYATPAGAVGMRTTAIYALEKALPLYITDTGLLTDELTSNTVGASQGIIQSSVLFGADIVNARILPDESYGVGTTGALSDRDYTNLQIVRADVIQALGALATYDTGSTKIGDPGVMRGELYALEGYTEILLADFFCSGVPLSTVDFQQDYTYRPSSTTAHVYQHALLLEDSALTLADTSTQVLNLAKVLKGRALLALDSVASAAQAVATVPLNFQYRLAIMWVPATRQGTGIQANILNASATVADREGHNGLPFLSSNDPRTTASVTVQPTAGVYTNLTFPNKYPILGFAQFPVADGIEARLIGAEAVFRSGNTGAMLDTLNYLRQNATVPGQTSSPLDPLSDPGTTLSGTTADSARAALLFQERGYWLFLTGHRQGDFRRQLRQYPQYWHGDQRDVYPTGPYGGLGTASYGSDVTAPIPGQEYLNPLYHGCINRAP